MTLSKLRSIGCSAVLVLSVALLGACALFEQKDETEGWSAQKLYVEAKEKLRTSDYETAIKYFEILQGRYPFGRYAQQAQIEIAYAYYKYDEPDLAIATLDRFIQTYPRHPFVDYAYYLKGLVNFDRVSGLVERFLPRFPDRTDTAAATESFQDFSELARRFPDSKYANDARQRMVYLRNNLAAYEVNVAAYYLDRGANVAAVNRSAYVLENLSRSPAVEDALALMTDAYLRMGMVDLAGDSLRVLRLNHPESTHLRGLESEFAKAARGTDEPVS